MKRFLLKKRGCILALALSAWLIIPLARATTGFTFFDYSARRMAAAPPGFREKAGGG